MLNFYTEQELKQFNFLKIGKNVLISKSANLYNTNFIEIGDNVRIDDFVIISASINKIKIGSHIHIACYSFLIGSEYIEIGNFSSLSSRSGIYSSSDDYSGNYLMGPHLKEYSNVFSRPVILGEFVSIASNVTILPGTYLPNNVAIGMYSFVNDKHIIDPDSIYAGIPLKKIKSRSNEYKKFTKNILKNEQ
jgi:galactoside O-acetyltransferase